MLGTFVVEGSHLVIVPKKKKGIRRWKFGEKIYYRQTHKSGLIDTNIALKNGSNISLSKQHSVLKPG